MVHMTGAAALPTSEAMLEEFLSGNT